MSNYELFITEMTSIDITDFEDVVEALEDESNTVEAAVKRIVALKTFKEHLKRLSTDKKCPRCGKTLYLSDLEDYDYLCTDCQENFYECEVK